MYLEKTVYSLLLLATSILLLAVLMYFSIYYEPLTTVLLNYRFNRVLSVVFTGFILGVIGSYLQACLRNPLVDHYILGIGSGSLFTVYLSIILFGFNIYVSSSVAIIGGLTALFITISIAETIGGSDTAYVLSGLGVNSLFSGLSILLIYIVSSKYPLAIHLFIGSFALASPDHHLLLMILSIILLSSYFILVKPLNTLMLGDIYAKQLGFNPRFYRSLTIILSGSLASIVVSLYGLIGFIGLVSPHISRFLIKTIDNRLVSPLSGVVSALLLLLTDDFSRMILSNYIGEIPTGAIVSVFGAPFFLFLILTRFRGRVG